MKITRCFIIFLFAIFSFGSFAASQTAHYRCKDSQEASVTFDGDKLYMSIGLSQFNKQLNTFRFKENGEDVVMQRAASDDNSEAIMSFIMPNIDDMTLLIKKNEHIIVTTTCTLIKIDEK